MDISVPPSKKVGVHVPLYPPGFMPMRNTKIRCESPYKRNQLVNDSQSSAALHTCILHDSTSLLHTFD